LPATYCKLEIFRYLTEIGADNNIRDVQSNTSVQYAAFSGRVKNIKILLDKGMSVNLTDTYVLRYVFQLNVVIWKQRKIWSKEVLLSTTLMKIVALHSFRLQ
jgi:ankyrin repeat protein